MRSLIMYPLVSFALVISLVAGCAPTPSPVPQAVAPSPTRAASPSATPIAPQAEEATPARAETPTPTSEPPTPTPKPPTPTPELPTPEPTETPAPPTPTSEPTATKEAEVEVSAPAVEGLRYENGYYYTEAGNPYGLEAGEKAGYYLPDVVLADVADKTNPEGEKVGGVVLDERVVLSLSAETKREFVLALPVDPGNLQAKVSVMRAEYSGSGEGFDGAGIFLIKTPNGSKLVSPWSGALIMGSTVEGKPDFYYPNPESLIQGHYLHIQAISEESLDRGLGEMKVGSRICTIASAFPSSELRKQVVLGDENISGWNVHVEVSSEDGARNLTLSDILRVDGSLVFVRVNK